MPARTLLLPIGILTALPLAASAQDDVSTIPHDRRTANAPTTVPASEEIADVPQFMVDPFWPKPLPNNWILGQVSGVHVDSDDHVWIVQRPNSLSDREIAATQDPPGSKCCFPAPPVLEFDQSGNVLRAWGGPGEGYDWPRSEHGIHLAGGYVWLAGNGQGDSQILKFTMDGEFVMQIGRPDESAGSNDIENLGRPADLFVHVADREVYVADGYGNRRIVVFDSETGEYKRHWGAYGNRPTDGPMPPRPFPTFFAAPSRTMIFGGTGGGDAHTTTGCDLAFGSLHAAYGRVRPNWRASRQPRDPYPVAGRASTSFRRRLCLWRY